MEINKNINLVYIYFIYLKNKLSCTWIHT